MECNVGINGFRKNIFLNDSDRCISNTKRISLKSLTNGKTLLPGLSVFHTVRFQLQQAVKAVFDSKPVEFTLEELYRYVEDICSQQMIMELYSLLTALFEEYVIELLPKYLKDGFELGSVAQCWEMYCRKTLLIRNIFLHMDRQLILLNAQCLQIWDLALKLFREDVITRDHLVQSRLLHQILEEIRKERCGEVINRELLRSVIYMLVDLKLYESAFLSDFIQRSQQLYAYEASTFSRQMPVSDYLHHVNKRMNEEEDRLVSYLDAPTTRPLLKATLVNELLTGPVDYLLENGLVEPLKLKQTTQLSLFYTLLSNVPNGIDKLRAHFRNYVVKLGHEIVVNPKQDVEKDKVMIQNLLDCREFLSDIIQTCFAKDASFLRVLHEAYIEVINYRSNKPAEYLAKYLDCHLKSGNKSLTEEELDKLMDKTMLLFRFINGKDIFEAFYTKELAKRLLLNRSASVDAEKSMLSKLKQECGPNYTRKMEVMFQDIELSRQLSKNFRTTVSNSYGIDLTVNIICPSSWPTYPQTKANYPVEMVNLREEFTRFYLSHHHGRKLTYEPTLGTCVVKAKLPSTPNISKELHVSEFQALVLLLFNDPINVPLKYSTILENVGIDEPELKRTLLSLSAGKSQRILLKTPHGIDIEPNHEFCFNTAFQHRLTRIKFNQVQLKETVEEQVATEEKVFADRVAHVDCCIVRIMKTRKSVDHNDLLVEVFKQLQFQLKPSDVKKRIENLIERDYMKRDADNNALYHYIA